MKKRQLQQERKKKKRKKEKRDRKMVGRINKSKNKNFIPREHEKHIKLRRKRAK